ncbi:MAG: polyribonucleotide nucleotidyltransferase [Candidatus Sungbacteria bacterium]|uniref:Polyribonucleotide nucleotidyltransferase n=1 Tax=Candidatus Sungiibacteriota bacterium TaxID=2750080 RepID=A0A931YE63_9BACT|nr:polyribonucleotide nucleotidyltransferase [Candidatus Sungbacteria bacterium]
MEIKKAEVEIGGRKLVLETGRLAQQANGAVVASYGQTMVLATVVMAKTERVGINYFPLTVDFDEKLYAAGRIKGSRWVKREGRPTDEAILTSRLVDRTLRPLFNSRLRNEVQVILTTLSFDGQNDPDIPAITAASAALLISGIPWNGPVAAVRVGRGQNKQLIINPTYAEREAGDLDLVVSGPENLVNMIECGSNEVSEADLVAAFSAAQIESQKLIELQNKFANEVGRGKILATAPQPDESFRKEIKSRLGAKLEEILRNNNYDAVEEIKKDLFGWLVESGKNPKSLAEAETLLEEELDELVHKNILTAQKRVDGRAMDEIRPLYIEVGVLPRTHGSAIFQRGQTQALCAATLAAPGLEQSIETMEFVGTKRYFHHYNFPPFSSGETGRVGFPGRREIGHGALSERSVEPIIPPKEEFPYTIRVVTEILSSNGSTSMASVCGSTLALMDAGVKIKKPVAGIAMGLFVEDEKNPDRNFAVITDLAGPEDHHGDMDFKIAGTADGINGLQMDVKVSGLTAKILETVLKQARKARLEILAAMLKVIPAPREKLSQYAPKILTLKINPDKIRDVIGSGGKTIHQITDATGVTIDIEDSGLIFITSENDESAQKALEWIKNITHEVAPGEIFQGRIVRILNFGAFAEILPGQQGLIHISELAPYRVNKVEDIVKIGDMVPVVVKNIDSEGRINLSLKDTRAEKSTSTK